MEKDVIEAIQENEEEINKLKNQNKFMQTIDFSKPVDEETWHKICETPLRTSQLLGILVKNTFPEMVKKNENNIVEPKLLTVPAGIMVPAVGV